MNASLPLCMAQALAPFAPPSSAVHQIVKDPFHGLYQHEYITDGLVLRCFLEHTPAFKDGISGPSWREKIDLVYVFVGVIDIAAVLDPQVKADIEASALKQMHAEQWQSDFDAAEQRMLDSIGGVL